MLPLGYIRTAREVNDSSQVGAGTTYPNISLRSLGKYYTSVKRGLVGFWPLDDLQDRSGNNYHLTNVSGQGPIGSNVSNKVARNFNGTGYFGNSSFPWPTSQLPITITFWAKTQNPGANSTGFTIGADSVQRCQGHIPWSDGTLYFDYGDTSNTDNRISTSYSSYADKWTHIALVSNGTNLMQLHFNGSPIGATVTGTHPLSNLTGIRIGGYGSDGQYGPMRDFRVYNRVLSPAEIKTIYSESFTVSGEIPFVLVNSGGPAGTSSILIPDADSVDGSWLNELGGTTLVPSIDEAVADTADYIISSASPVSDICKVSLSNPAGGIQEPMTVSYQYGKQGGGSINLKVRLMEGSTQIVEWVHTNIATGPITVTQTLTSPQFASIVDPTNLFLEFEAAS